MKCHSALVPIACVTWCAGILVWALAAGVLADSPPVGPPKPPVDKAPWQRMLTGDDAKRAAELEKKLGELVQSDKFAEAQAVARQIVELRSRVQGAEHWQTANARVQLDLLKRWERLPAAERTRLDEAAELNARVMQLWQAGKYREALPLAEKDVAIRREVFGENHPYYASSLLRLGAQHRRLGAYAAARSYCLQSLAIDRKVLGEEHPDTALSYFCLADILLAQGKFAEAEPLARKALAIRQNVLGEDHTDTAASYGNLASNLDAQGKYAEAEPLARKALAINRKVLGEEHHVTAIEYEAVASILDHQGKHAEAEPLCREALAIRRKVLGEEHPDTAAGYLNLAYNLSAQYKCAEAEQLCRKALAICRKVLGEEHPTTATSYINLAFNLDDQGKHAEAESLGRKALAIRQKVLGEEHPDTAASYQNLAMNLRVQGRYAEAVPLSRKALAIRRNVQGEEHPNTAASYSNLALLLDAQGNYAEAEPFFRKALAILRKALGEEHPDTAKAYDGVASILGAQEKHAEAEPLHRKALAIRLKMLGEQHPDTARSYNNLAFNLDDQDKHAEAEPLYRKAVAIWHKARGEDNIDTAPGYANLARNLDIQGKYAEAEPLHRKALAIRVKVLGEEHHDTVLSYGALAFNLDAQGKYTEAQKLWRTASHGFEAARFRFSSAGLERATFADLVSPLPRLSASLARTGQPREAWKFWEASLARGLFDDLAARLTRPLTEQERDREQALLGQLQLLDKQAAALRELRERTDSASQQLDRLQKQREAVQTELAQFEAELDRTYGPAAGQVYELDRIQTQLPADAALVYWLDLRNLAQAADPEGDHWACIVRKQGQPAWVKLRGSGPKNAWIKADDQLAEKLGLLVVERPSEATAKWRELAGQLYQQRLAPLAEHLGATHDLPAVRQLIVLPSRWLAGVPVEALVAVRTDQQPAYTVGYAPSGTMFAWLQEQRQKTLAKGHKPRAPRLLALGDPVFAAPMAMPPAPALPERGVLLIEVVSGSNAAQAGLRANDVLLSYAGQELSKADDLLAALCKPSSAERIPIQIWREGKALSLTVPPGKLGVVPSTQPAAEALRAQREFATLMQRRRGPAFSRLPGTGREVKAIARLFDQPDILLGSKASEQQLDALTSSGRLKEYAYLHLATHGLLDAQLPLRSALVLAEDDLPDPLTQALAGKRAYDGRLTAEQILRTWKLDADMVTLSACQTGLGKYQKGEGYLGFAQALFVAGGRSLVLSLWPVNDDATALLMSRFYQNVLGKRAGLDKPMPKAEALREAKEWLRGLSSAEVDKGLADLHRGEPIEKPPALGAEVRPYGHPYYWAAFILIGDPQ
jgi:CHAT domain-containing protein/tetratricopeptide (TPR) repeat protein